MINKPVRANQIRFFPPKRMPCGKDCDCYACQMRIRILLRSIGLVEPLPQVGKTRKLTPRQITAAYYKP